MEDNDSQQQLDVSAGLRLVQVEVCEVELAVQTGQTGVVVGVALALHTGGADGHRPDLVLVVVVASLVVLERRVEQVGRGACAFLQSAKIF